VKFEFHKFQDVTVGSEKHNGEELTISGGWRAHDAAERAEEEDSDNETEGKRSTRSHGVSTRKES
jgi:hypothetical protein